MPVFLVGASGVFLREDLLFDEAGLGLAIAVFFGVSMATSVWGGRIAERVGAGRALVVVSVGVAGIMVGIGSVTERLFHLALLLALGGALHGLAAPATNLALARGVASRPALMFGIKQSAVPVATMIAGASVPMVSLTVGWRWAFVAAAGLSLGVAIFVPRGMAPGTVRSTRSAREGDAATRPLVALAVAAAAGVGAATSLAAFLVEALVAGGIAVGAAGWLLVAGSLSAILARLGAGVLADRRRGRALYAVSTMLTLGAVGYGLLAVGGPWFSVVGTVLAYALGWGWPGLMNFAVVRLNPNAPAAASGIVMAGVAGGGALGPLTFGYVVTLTSYRVAWVLAGSAALLSAVLVLTARRWLLADRDRRQMAS
jgi:predicted MFS family arabinose efflux permease